MALPSRYATGTLKDKTLFFRNSETTETNFTLETFTFMKPLYERPASYENPESKSLRNLMSTDIDSTGK